MRFYTCRINLDGDVRHVVQKRGVTAAEIQVLQAIHGQASVYEIALEPQNKSRDNTPHKAVAEQLDRRYGRVRVGSDNNPRPVLPQVFPGWPNVRFPTDAKDAGINPELLAEDKTPKKSGGRSTKKSEPASEPEAGESDTSFTE